MVCNIPISIPLPKMYSHSLPLPFLSDWWTHLSLSHQTTIHVQNANTYSNCLSVEISTQKFYVKISYYGWITKMQNVPNAKAELTVHKSVMWHYNILLNCIRFKSTDGNFGTREKLAIPITIVTCILPSPIPSFGVFVFSFPWDSHPWEWKFHSHAHLLLHVELSINIVMCQHSANF